MSALPARVLLVDDNVAALASYERRLRAIGCDPVTARDGRSGMEAFRAGRYDLVVSDIGLPDLSGLDLLRTIREADADVPVILMSGNPTLEGAMHAVELRAFRLLAKPLVGHVLEEMVQSAIVERRHAVERTSWDERAMEEDPSLEARFESALEGLRFAFQPIVDARARSIMGFEALLRSSEPSLSSHGNLVDAARRLGRMFDAGRTVRTRIARELPSDARVFVKLDAIDLLDHDLYERSSPLTTIADRIVFAITERASLAKIDDLDARFARLRSLGFTIAIDGLGAGFSGLTCFSVLAPEYAKIDASLIRGCDGDPRKRRIVGAILSLGADLGVRMVCEGVERGEECEALLALGGRLMQGYWFAKPGRDFPTALESPGIAELG